MWAEGTISYEEKGQLLMKLVDCLNNNRQSYTLTGRQIGGAWVQELQCDELDLRIEVAGSDPVLNRSVNGSMQAWHDGRYWMVNKLEDFENADDLKGKIIRVANITEA